MAFESIKYHGISTFYQAQNTHSLGYYLEAGYRFSSDLQGFIRHERFYLDKDDKYGKAFHRRYPSLPVDSRYSRIWAAGFNWDISPVWMFRAEYQTHIGAAILSETENNPQRLHKHWNLYALSLSYRF